MKYPWRQKLQFPPFLSFSSLLLLFYPFWIRAVKAGIFSSDPRYTLWPNPARIPYQIETNNLNAQDFSVLSAGMNQISVDTGSCIKFVPYDPAVDRGSDFILFRNKLTVGPVDLCYTFPGLVRNNGFGQVAVVFGSSSFPGSQVTLDSSRSNLPGACLDNQRDTMRILMNLLGVRNEHNRIDRDTFLTFQSTDPNSLIATFLQKYNIFNKYNTSQATIASTFDYNSITLVNGEKYAASPNSPVFVTTGANSLGQLPRLSRTDCLVINMLYRCNSACPDPYATTGSVTFNPPTTFTKHLYCPPLVSSSVLTTPVVIGDVSVANAPGVVFRYTLSPQVSFLEVTATTTTVFAVTLPAARILLTAIPTKGFVNSQFTLTATSGTLQGSTTFVTSSAGRPTFNLPQPISQPTTFTQAPQDAFTATLGTTVLPGMFVNCRLDPADPTGLTVIELPSTLGFVGAIDPEGGRIFYYVTGPFTDANFGKGYHVTQDGVVAFADNHGDPFPFQTQPYASSSNTDENVFIAAVDPAGGISVIHYRVFTQCAPVG